MSPIIFSELDQCLLDKSASHELASDALYEISDKEIPLVLSSNRSLEDMLSKTANLPQKPYLIGENGACFAVPIHSKLNKYFSWNASLGDYNVYFNPHSKSRILQVLKGVRESIGDCFIEFSNICTRQTDTLNALESHDLSLSLNRQANEFVIWQGSDYDWWIFKDHMEQSFLSVLKGDFFAQVMEASVNKATGMFYMLNLFRNAFPNTRWFSVGLGASVEDVSMLEHVDYPVVVRKPKSSHLQLERSDYQLTESFSSQAWNESMLQFLNLSLSDL